MSKLYLMILTLMVLPSLVLTACNSKSLTNINDASPYIPSSDTHSCLGVGVVAPDAIELETETMVRIEVNNRCNEATTYESSGPPYSLALVHDDHKIVWYTPSEPVPDILLEYTVEANGITSYNVPVLLSADEVTPGKYRVIANLFVDQMEPDATQYVEPLRLEPEPQNVDIKTLT